MFCKRAKLRNQLPRTAAAAPPPATWRRLRYGRRLLPPPLSFPLHQHRLACAATPYPVWLAPSHPQVAPSRSSAGQATQGSPPSCSSTPRRFPCSQRRCWSSRRTGRCVLRALLLGAVSCCRCDACPVHGCRRRSGAASLAAAALRGHPAGRSLTIGPLLRLHPPMQEPVPTVSSAASPDLIYDYHGFPPEASERAPALGGRRCRSAMRRAPSMIGPASHHCSRAHVPPTPRSSPVVPAQVPRTRLP